MLFLSLFYWYDVKFSVFLKVEHPLVYDDMIIEGLDLQCMLPLRHFDACLLQRLTTQHTHFPELRAVGFFE